MLPMNSVGSIIPSKFSIVNYNVQILNKISLCLKNYTVQLTHSKIMKPTYIP